MWKHKKICKVIRQKSIDAKDERIAMLQEQLREKLTTALDQLNAKDEEIRHLREQVSHLSSCISTQFTELRGELVQTKKRKDRYAEATAIRRPRTEPERRRVAQGQGWKCANPDGGCLLPGELQEYDIDHVIPLWKGGPDEPENLQALCPACHRRKTNRERVERSVGTLSAVATGGQGV
jgi:5-methylcytosine-specific restriction endonuclease McrA